MTEINTRKAIDILILEFLAEGGMADGKDKASELARFVGMIISEIPDFPAGMYMDLVNRGRDLVVQIAQRLGDQIAENERLRAKLGMVVNEEMQAALQAARD